MFLSTPFDLPNERKPEVYELSRGVMTTLIIGSYNQEVACRIVSIAGENKNYKTKLMKGIVRVNSAWFANQPIVKEGEK